jgi:hypothetical protein
MFHGANLLTAAETDQHITVRDSFLGSSAAVVSLCVKAPLGVLGMLNIQPPDQMRLAILILKYYLAIKSLARFFVQSISLCCSPWKSETN